MDRIVIYDFNGKPYNPYLPFGFVEPKTKLSPDTKPVEVIPPPATLPERT